MTLCARHHAAARTYRASAKSAACVGGFISNMGHYFCNEVSGLERVLLAGFRPPVLLTDPRWLPLHTIFAGGGLSIVPEVAPDRAVPRRLQRLRRDRSDDPRAHGIDLHGHRRNACALRRDIGLGLSV